MKQTNKAKKLSRLRLPLVLAVIVLAGIILGVLWQNSSRSPSSGDACTDKDREVGNCVPAGKCGPTPEIDAVIDCDVKNYDRKYRLDACTDKDWEINNCVPAGKCTPNGDRDNLVDCFDQVKDYDSKYNIDF